MTMVNTQSIDEKISDKSPLSVPKESLVYCSVIYHLNQVKKEATRINIEGHNHHIFPKIMPFHNLATLLSKMQKVCFKDYDVNNKNHDRMVEIFSQTQEKTVAVVISIGHKPDTNDYMDFEDAGAASIQKTKLGFLQYQQPCINEICRSNIKNIRDLPSPVSTVMDLVETYVKSMMGTNLRINGMYLYIEKNPDLGSSSFLLNYYRKYGFSKLDHEDDEYFYMSKNLHSPQRKKKTIKNRGKRNRTRRNK